MTRPSVGIAVVNWNAGEALARCMASVSASDWSAVDLDAVVVVDNGSTDGSADHLPATLSLTVIRNAVNRGFGAACNQAAATLASDYILFLNPDTRVGADTIPVAVAWLEEPSHAQTGIVGVQLFGDDGTVSRTCARFPTAVSMSARAVGVDRLFPRVFPAYVMEEWDHAVSRPVDHVIGAFFLVRRALFERLGGFDERFFVYLEDLDFSRRASLAGSGSFYLATTRAYHRGGGTSDQIRATRLFYALRSRLQYARKHYGAGGAALVSMCTWCIEPGIRALACLAGRSPTGLADTIEAYRQLWRARETTR